MSIYHPPEEGDTLSEREIRMLKRLLSDSFNYPPEFFTAIKTRLASDPPDFTDEAIMGFANSAERAVPAIPQVILAVDISAANTDLPRPSRDISHIWMINPGGGSLRGIGEPVREGTRVTLKGSWIGSTTIKHNVGGPGTFDRPIFLSGGADLVLKNSESLELVYVDTFWQDVGGSGSGGGVDGWTAAEEVWTYASADDPTFVFTAPGDLTGKYGPGVRLKLTQTTEKYFIITKVAHAAGTTTITVYGGTDYDLANAAITLPFYSRDKAPHGFPLNPDKWTVEVTKTGNSSQGGAGAGTWYNLDTFSISIPIGCWIVQYHAMIYADSDDDVDSFTHCTLSTANNSQSDSSMTTAFRGYGGGFDQGGASATKERVIDLAAKTSYYLNHMTQNGGSTLWMLSGDAPAYIRAVCAYL